MNHTQNKQALSEKIFIQIMVLAISGALFAEIMFLLVQGVILFPGTPVMNMVIWGSFCGIGMGSAAGAFIILFVVNKYHGKQAIIRSTIFASIALNACGYLCYELALIFDYYGARELREIFVIKNAVLSFAGSAFVSWLVFSEKGQIWLKRIGL